MSFNRVASALFFLVLTVFAQSCAPREETSEPESDGELNLIRLFKQPVSVPAFTITDVDGRTISSDKWRGKVVFVNFWATWCPPCRAEIPDLVALQKKYADQILIVGISEDEGPVE